MVFEAYPEDVELVKTNFKTDQQQEAAESIVEQWPVDLDTLVEEGDHVRVFYQRVIEQFIGPAGTDATFDEIESEYGSVEEWQAQNGDAADSTTAEDEADATEQEDDADDQPTAVSGIAGSDVLDEDDLADLGDGAEASTEGSSTGTAADAGPALDAAQSIDGVDEQRREWFAIGFREGVKFALQNPDLVREQ